MKHVLIDILFLTVAAGAVVLPASAAEGQAQTASTALTTSENSISAYAGMGIHFLSASGIVKYINAQGYASGRVDDWGTAVEFFGGIEIPVSPQWGVKLEHSYLFKSYTVDDGVFSQDLSYHVQAPMVLAQYVIPGKGYFVKFGAGGGYHWGTVTPPKMYGAGIVYHASGIGMRAEAEGQTAFDAHLFGYISGTLGFEALGKVTSDSGAELANGAGSVSLNYLNAGLRFGLIWYF